MEKKLRQVTDNIHGTIFLSSLESDLISTPYFYRLHDIYQSSTVYMTFPSNRTKRYEHSLGTMELASSILFSAVSNASQDTRDELFKRLRHYFEAVFDLAICQSGNQVAPYFTKYRNKIDEVFAGKDLGLDIDTMIQNIMSIDIRKAVVNGCFADSALEQYQYYQLNMEREGNDAQDSVDNLFLYRCLLQAVRIVALFHDVGHPPFSHIIEAVLEQLYKESLDDNCGWNKTRRHAFQKALKPYATEDPLEAYKCQTLYSNSSSVEAHLHERIGLSMLQSAINDVIPELLSDVIDSSKENCCKIASILYYVFVVELAMGMLTEKDLSFKSFHKIVDGPLDADRMDYIMRDSLNSGVDWGKIPYKRLINSNKLVYLSHDADGKELADENRPFIIAYPRKITDDIVDLLLTRYKIFARINFHHRCMKTAVALQSAVAELAEDYLRSDNNNEINADINILWSALDMGVGDRKIRIIQWNDSWLISVLHKALVKLIADNRTNSVLRENLEEILLNKKRYYSLIKRGSDSQRFVQIVFDYAEITDEKLAALKQTEYRKYYAGNHGNVMGSSCDIFQSSESNAEEALKRIRKMIRIKETGDLELLNTIMPLNGMCVNDTIRRCMDGLKEQGIIADYSVFTNGGRRKTGLPSHKNLLEEIYLYDGEDWEAFRDEATLQPQIMSIERNVPWTYIYFVPPKNSKNVKELSRIIIDEAAKAVGTSLKVRYQELFGA